MMFFKRDIYIKNEPRVSNNNLTPALTSPLASAQAVPNAKNKMGLIMATWYTINSIRLIFALKPKRESQFCYEVTSIKRAYNVGFILGKHAQQQAHGHTPDFNIVPLTLHVMVVRPPNISIIN